jgi:hypothetical protein
LRQAAVAALAQSFTNGCASRAAPKAKLKKYGYPILKAQSFLSISTDLG